MNPLPLSAPGLPMVSSGDIVTIEGQYNRPRVKSMAWLVMLVFGPEFACRHLGWAFRRKASDEFYHVAIRRRALLRKRQLQTYRITDQTEVR